MFYLRFIVKPVAMTLLAALLLTCSQDKRTVKRVMDECVTRLYQTMNEQELASLDNEKILNLFSNVNKNILASRYWSFDTNVPVIVSVMQHEAQPVFPFWLEEAGFVLTDLKVRNEEYGYNVWQKSFPHGRVGLGINGFDKHRPHYFICIGPENKGDKVKLSGFFPEKQHVSVVKTGAFTYHDWDELVLTEVPEELSGQILLTTIRGRAREAHLIDAFRRTPVPSSEEPDQLMLTWSGDPSHTQSIQWRTNTLTEDGIVRYWKKLTGRNAVIKEVKAERRVLEDRLLENDRFIHRFTAFIKDLDPATVYAYQVGSHEEQKWSKESEFITAPLGDAPFTFVYFGDTHRSPEWGELIYLAHKNYPETAFYVVAGDLVSTGLYREDWDRFFQFSADVIRNRPLVPSLGNHDDQDGLGASMYLDLFALPQNAPDHMEKERVYSFNYSNALFLILDATSPPEEQAGWLEKQLSSTDADWKFAVFHFPPFMDRDDYKDIRQIWGAVFDRYHVDMVMSGHVHYYARSKPIFDQKPAGSPAHGTIYVTSIAIPAGDNENPDPEYTEVHFGGGWLYQRIDLIGNQLRYRVFDRGSNIRDEFIIEK